MSSPALLKISLCDPTGKEITRTFTAYTISSVYQKREGGKVFSDLRIDIRGDTEVDDAAAEALLGLLRIRHCQESELTDPFEEPKAVKLPPPPKVPREKVDIVSAVQRHKDSLSVENSALEYFCTADGQAACRPGASFRLPVKYRHPAIRPGTKGCGGYAAIFIELGLTRSSSAFTAACYHDWKMPEDLDTEMLRRTITALMPSKQMEEIEESRKRKADAVEEAPCPKAPRLSSMPLPPVEVAPKEDIVLPSVTPRRLDAFKYLEGMTLSMLCNEPVMLELSMKRMNRLSSVDLIWQGELDRPLPPQARQLDMTEWEAVVEKRVDLSKVNIAVLYFYTLEGDAKARDYPMQVLFTLLEETKQERLALSVVFPAHASPQRIEKRLLAPLFEYHNMDVVATRDVMELSEGSLSFMYILRRRTVFETDAVQFAPCPKRPGQFWCYPESHFKE